MSDTQADKAADRSSIASPRRRDHKTALIFTALALVYPTTQWSIAMWWRDFVPVRIAEVHAREPLCAHIPFLQQPSVSKPRQVGQETFHDHHSINTQSKSSNCH